MVALVVAKDAGLTDGPTGGSSMKSTLAFAIVGGVVLGLSCPMANAAEWKNQYFYSQAGSTVVAAPAAAAMTSADGTTTTLSLPVTVAQPAAAAPLTVEDRIVKKKHFFKIGLWPIFDISIW